MTEVDPRTELNNQLEKYLEKHKVSFEEPREITITFRVSASEKARLEQRCRGVVQSDYIRARLFDYPLPHPKLIIPKVNRLVIYELKRIGTNLNQQTRAINEAVKVGRQPLRDGVREYLLSIKELAALLQQTCREITQTKSLPNGVRGDDYKNQS